MKPVHADPGFTKFFPETRSTPPEPPQPTRKPVLVVLLGATPERKQETLLVDRRCVSCATLLNPTHDVDLGLCVRGEKVAVARRMQASALKLRVNADRSWPKGTILGMALAVASSTIAPEAPPQNSGL